MNRHALLLGTASLLLHCGAPAPEPDTAGRAPVPPGGVSVERVAGAYRVHANEAGPFAVLRALGEAAGFEARRGTAGIDDTPRTLGLERASLAEAIAAVLAGMPHHVHHDYRETPPPGDWPDAPTRLVAVTAGELHPEGRGAGGALGAILAAAEGEVRGSRTPGTRRGAPYKGPTEEEIAARRAQAAQREAARQELIQSGWQDEDPARRREAARVLEPEGEELARLQALLMSDPDASVRAVAAETLGEGEGIDVAGPLLLALDDGDTGVVVASIESLESVYDDYPTREIRERVAALATHESERVRDAVEAFLAWIE